MNMCAWFLSLILLAPALTWAQTSMIVQQSPLAGFQYYPGKALGNEMKVGDALTLQRQPSNPHDANAVIVFWNGQRLGYIPRRENSNVARQMEWGAPVKAHIVKMTEARNTWQRIAFEVNVDL
mgnify:FL=1